MQITVTDEMREAVKACRKLDAMPETINYTIVLTRVKTELANLVIAAIEKEEGKSCCE